MNDITNRNRTQVNDLVFQQAAEALHNALDIDASVHSGAGCRTDRSIHTLGVAAAGKNTDSFDFFRHF